MPENDTDARISADKVLMKQVRKEQQIKILDCDDLLERLNIANKRALQWMDTSLKHTVKIVELEKELENLNALEERIEEILANSSEYRNKYQALHSAVSTALNMREEKQLAEIKKIIVTFPITV